jgi:hypothetical protein
MISYFQSYLKSFSIAKLSLYQYILIYFKFILKRIKIILFFDLLKGLNIAVNLQKSS